MATIAEIEKNRKVREEELKVLKEKEQQKDLKKKFDKVDKKVIMSYKKSDLLEIVAEGGVVFINLLHKEFNIEFKTFLGDHIKNSQLILLNEEDIKKKIKQLEEQVEKDKKFHFDKNIMLLEIEKDLKTIYSEYN